MNNVLLKYFLIKNTVFIIGSEEAPLDMKLSNGVTERTDNIVRRYSPPTLFNSQNGKPRAYKQNCKNFLENNFSANLFFQ